MPDKQAKKSSVPIKYTGILLPARMNGTVIELDLNAEGKLTKKKALVHLLPDK